MVGVFLVLRYDFIKIKAAADASPIAIMPEIKNGMYATSTTKFTSLSYFDF